MHGEQRLHGDATRSVQNCTLSVPGQFRLRKTVRVTLRATGRCAPV